MPSTYAHERFGNAVLDQLVSHEKSHIIRSLPFFSDLLHLGFQGPDFLFFYHPVIVNKIVREGIRIHDTSGLDFFSNADALLHRLYRHGKSSERFRATFSYLVGAICHFALDATCHPFVDAFEEAHKEENKTRELPVFHAEIEGQFDRFLMEQDGKVPTKVDIMSPIHPSAYAASILVPLYPSVPKYKILPALKGFVFVNRLLYCPSDSKRNIMYSAARMLGIYSLVHGHTIAPKADPVYSASNERLLELFDTAISRAVRLIRALEKGFEADEMEKSPERSAAFLSDEFLRLNFSGRTKM